MKIKNLGRLKKISFCKIIITKSETIHESSKFSFDKN